MNQEEIIRIIAKGEDIRTEFKLAENSVPSSLYETVVSFSNTDGGTIILGVDKNGTITGISPMIISRLASDLVTSLNSRDCINPPLYIKPYVIELDSRNILVLQVQSSSQVHNHSGRIYIREHESDIDITDNQIKVSDLYLLKRNLFTEGQIYPHVTYEDLDGKLFDKARILIRNYRSDHPWLLGNDDQMLRDSILWKKDFTTGQEGLTLAAVLIFGKDITIQNILPAYKVEAMVRIRDRDRWDDRITLRTNLIDTYLALRQFINKHLPEKFFMEADQRIDLRDKIFREVIGNVIVHREYTSALSTDLIIDDKAVIVTNPNKPMFHGPIDPAGFNPFPKNPNIRKFFTAFGWTDEIGSGIRNTNKYLPLYVPGVKPLFIENDTFKTEVPLVFVTLGYYAKLLAAWLEMPEQETDRIESALGNIALPSFLANKDWEEVLLHLLPNWHKNGTRFRQLDWPVKQPFMKFEKKKVPSKIPNGTKSGVETGTDYQDVISIGIKKVPSWDEKGTKLLSKKSVYLLSIMILSGTPVKREEIMNILKYENRKTFNDLYLAPLIQSGLIRRTNEDNPRDPGQQYYLTELGKAFIGGTLNQEPETRDNIN